MERMQLLYHSQAEAKQLLVVSAAGFDSVPADLGVLATADCFGPGGACAYVESFLTLKAGPKGFVGESRHSGGERRGFCMVCVCA